jgi:hypothetical protein
MRLYHATWPSRVETIERDGILPAPDNDVVYLANKPHYAAGFLRMRGHEYLGIIEVRVPVLGLVSAPILNMPDLAQHDDIVVYEVEVDESLVEESTDHSPGIVPDDLESFVHHGPVAVTALAYHSTHPTQIPVKET